MADINDLLNFADAQQPTKFASAFDEIMGQKIVNSMDDVRVSVAQGMFASEEPEEDDFEDEDFDVDAEDDDDILDDDDDDFDDIDWDDEDFDLDEDDLEGLEDDGEDA